MAEETRQDVLLKRTQVIIAILTGLIALVVGIYNAKNLFGKKEPSIAAPVAPPPPSQNSSPLRSAIEETGASWIKTFSAKSKSEDSQQK